MDLHRSDTTRMAKFSGSKLGGSNFSQHILETAQKTPELGRNQCFLQAHSRY